MKWYRIGKIILYSMGLGSMFGYVGFFVWSLSIQQVRQMVFKQVGFNVLMMGIMGIALTTTIVSAYSIREIYHVWKGDV